MLTIARATVTEETVNDRLSRFVVEPLAPGFGYTVGNAMRRTLLSAVGGAAVTAIKIDGVLHEFTTIPGVTEDVTELVLNIKALVVAFDSDDETATMRLQAKGPGDVTAADIEVPTGVRIVNSDAKIATLNAKGRLDIELIVERGTGFEVADRMKRKDAIGLLPVDAVFSPVRRVAFTVESTRVEQMTNFDKLVLEVETDGSVAPLDSVVEASRHLTALVGLFSELVDGPAPAAVEAPTGAGSPLIDNERPVEQLDLPIRALNCLKREGINTLGELLEFSPEDLMDIRNFGDKSVVELQEKLAEMGLSLATRDY